MSKRGKYRKWLNIRNSREYLCYFCRERIATYYKVLGVDSNNKDILKQYRLICDKCGNCTFNKYLMKKFDKFMDKIEWKKSSKYKRLIDCKDEGFQFPLN